MGAGKNLAEATMSKISLMENRLSGTLKPVAPRQEFVHGLGERIQTGSRSAFVNPAANWHLMAILLAGLVSLAMVLAMLARALLMQSGKKRMA
jgi:hypothetical protein